jgi:hypothetical protein
MGISAGLLAVDMGEGIMLIPDPNGLGVATGVISILVVVVEYVFFGSRAMYSESTNRLLPTFTRKLPPILTRIAFEIPVLSAF